MAKRIKLTVGAIGSLTCPPDLKQVFIWDTEVTGLGVRATRSGKKTYVLQARIGDTQFRYAIGSVQAWSLDAPAKAALEIREQTARFEARRLLAEASKGTDPRVALAEQIAKTTAKRAAQEAAKQAEEHKRTTVGDAFPAYIEANRGFWGERHLLDHEKLSRAGGLINGKQRTAGALYSLMALPLESINADTIKAWLASEAKLKRPTQTALAYRLFRAFCNWCSESSDYRSLVSEGVFRKRELQRSVPKSNAKADMLQLCQIPAWFDAIKRIGSPVMSAYLQMLLITGARRGELARLKWADIDWRWRTIRIADKVEKHRDIPLTPYVQSLLLELKHRNDTPPAPFRIINGKREENDLANWKPSPWVFASNAAACGHITAPTKAHANATKAVELSNITLHGLRRTFATHGESEELNIPAGVVAQIMGHKPSATAERHYKVRPLDTLREWHTKIEAFLLSKAGVQFEYTTPQKAQTLRAVK